ncbi:MAG: 3-octaprenyl-4hydroxybenzoate decarboxylase [Candidatus Angelobacter sp.]|jgi:4-hydroxy-3-polyprenylbenzoate decarboxylase|nr:3-octaprenyl-4hydroxybenzoate decarboxylase [Candidatus Angelobacter sp.]
MAYNDLREWIAALERAGELKRVRTEVDPILEITEITDRVSKAGKPSNLPKMKPGGPALLFENIKGHPSAQVLINQFGSEDRMKLALGVDALEEISGRIHQLMNIKSPEGFLEKVKMLPMLAEFGKFFPKTVATGPCKEVIKKDTASLLDLPVLKCWPQDGGRFITLPCVITRDPRTGKRNVGMYRMQIYDERTAGMHWQRQKVAAEHYRDMMRMAATQSASGAASAPSSASRSGAVDIMARSLGGSVLAEGERPSGKLEVAVVIGTDPALTFSAIVPAPPDVEEFIVAGFLRQKPIELVKCETVDLEVPASAEIVLEGYVNLDELRTEGPFGDHTGFYSLEDEYPVFHLTCITHRKNPIYATTIVGKPPMEDAYMGKAVERIFLPLMRLTLPEIVDVNLPIEGVFHNLMIVSIKKSYPGHARKVMSGIWALGQAMFTKCIIVVDEDVDVQDIADVTLKALNHIDPERDIQFTMGPVDSLDHASRMPNYGSKMGIDATRKWATEGFTRPWPDEIRMDEKTKAAVDKKWKELGIE